MSSKVSVAKIIFVTGTDTGVGKTVITAMLTRYLRNSGVHALALKPFCSGSRDDVRHLRKAQDSELTLTEINPFYFDAPLAPLAAAQSAVKEKVPSLKQVISHARGMQQRCEILLIEGCGGVMVPLSSEFFVIDVIAALSAEVLLVARNELGTINHTLLSVSELHRKRCRKMKIILVDQDRADESSLTNGEILRALSHLPVSIFPRIPLGFELAQNPLTEKLKKILAAMV